MGKTTGGPLLCVDDLMQDLLSEESFCMQSLSSSSHNSGVDVITPTSESLEDVFQSKKAEDCLETLQHASGGFYERFYCDNSFQFAMFLHQPSISREASMRDFTARTYKDLELGLASSGHYWTSLTQQLYSALISANQVAAKVGSNLSFLSEKIASMRLVLERGDAAMNDLQAAVAQLRIDDI